MTPGLGNVVSGNGEGILIQGSGSDGNVIQGNLIGTDITGTRLLGSGQSGISITTGPNDTLIGGDTPAARNVIVGGEMYGVKISGISTDATRVQGNYIGVDASGAHAFPNGIGIYLGAGAKRSLVGGETPGTSNVVSGNRDRGVNISDISTDNNLIVGNFIGADATGTAALGNGTAGVVIEGWAKNNVIGGVNPSFATDGSNSGCSGRCNVISGNFGYGVRIIDRNTTGNQVLGNAIGTDKSGALNVGNALAGIAVDLGASGNKLGQDTAGTGNLIRFNGEGGVLLAVRSSANELTGNRIEENQGIAIRYRPGNTLGSNTCTGNGSIWSRLRPARWL
ncbi:hypothetical protein [Candidatus Amarolinea dominans]|uniref:hypothetical protein n=1 Tax=Candidatus Amarolinea dominans TaxID=3140696 RepID=UPI0031363B29|nr:hypothetical protein [Anaerolineae bacterium]